jgi:hypothetical protein
VLAALGGIAAWVWRHPRGDHGLADVPTANALTETFGPTPETSWMYDGESAPSTGQAWSEPDVGSRPPVG